MQALTRLGISGLDGRLPPIPRGYSILISGPSGSGKTIFALQSIYESASKYGERGVFISLKDFPRDVRRKATSIGFDISELEKRKMVILVDALSQRIGRSSEEPYVIEPSYNGILRFIKSLSREFERIDRVVIDPLSIMFKGRADLEEVLKLIATLSSLGITSISVCFEEDRNLLSYIFHGVIELCGSEDGSRKILVRKMEGLRLKTPVTVPYEIQRGMGIRVLEQGEGG